MSDRKIVEPGTPLAYSEELLAGPGVYDDGTQLRAAVYGIAHTDPKSMTLSIVPAGKAVTGVEKGDVVIGQVTYIKPEALASVKIIAVRGKEGKSLLIAKIDARFIKSVDEEMRTGDLIRAKVLGTQGGPQLATDKPEYGVVQARSPEGNVMELDGNRLRDPVTGKTYFRKLANDYGSGEV